MAHLQARFNKFFDAILNDLREMLRGQREPQAYSDEFGDEIVRHMRPLPKELEGSTK
jgi:hypothetical protein